MNKKREQFLSAMHAQDVAVFARNTTKIEGTYDLKKNSIDAKNTIDNVWVGIAIVGMLICLWQVW